MLAPPATCVPRLLGGRTGASEEAVAPLGSSTSALVDRVLGMRRVFGITRIGTITRLDRIGVPVVQVVRPLALSNAVVQGKGVDLVEAAASALMEAIETWAGERIPRSRLQTSSADALGPAVCELYAGGLSGDAQQSWDRMALLWLDGWDLFTATTLPVPAALVDTVYTAPSRHPRVFPRTTTGLGAGSSMHQAVVHAGLEVLERDAMAQAHRTPHFFDRWQVDVETVQGGISARILARLRVANLLTGIWRVPASHGLPIYWCHIMEDEKQAELVPLPAEGSACHFSHDGALTKALLEACQARLTAISGAREDVTRAVYPRAFDRRHLAAWRQQLRQPPRPNAIPRVDHLEVDEHPALDSVVSALRIAGAHAALVVPLFSDERAQIYVVRVVAPPLRPAPGH